ncbi:MAG: 50S ribosomal protein L10 [Deltaproteobacteria bacterium]|nr:50S ribosomal protein L10 [Deltaproteobacteria bacterium]
MNRTQKEVEIQKLGKQFSEAKAFLFSGYRGLKVQAITTLRGQLRKERVGLKVVKNRLVKRVLAERGLNDLEQFLDGPTALAWAESDPVSAAKVLVEFAKENESLVLRGGWLEGKTITLKDIETLAKLPSREVLLAKALGSMQAPATNFARVLAAVPKALVTALNAIKEKKA